MQHHARRPAAQPHLGGCSSLAKPTMDGQRLWRRDYAAALCCDRLLKSCRRICTRKYRSRQPASQQTCTWHSLLALGHSGSLARQSISLSVSFGPSGQLVFPALLAEGGPARLARDHPASVNLALAARCRQGSQKIISKTHTHSGRYTRSRCVGVSSTSRPV